MAIRILLVDDEPDLVDTLKLHLEKYKFEVIPAYDGDEALILAKKENPDLIILDLMLPKMNGFKVCKLLKSDEGYKHIPIILLTARATEQDLKMGKDAGADSYVTKPFEFDHLLTAIQQLLN